MKVVLLENPLQHRLHDHSEPRSIWEHVKSWVEDYGGGESELVRSFQEADSRLAQGGVDWLVIHHYRLKDVDNLRASYPDVKYAGASAMLLPKDLRHPGSFTEAFWNKLEGHYDFLLPDYGESILRMMGVEDEFMDE